MIHTIVGVEGMGCSGCEDSINEAVRENFNVADVTSSHVEKKTEIHSEAPLDEDALRSVIEDAGFEVTSVAIVD